LSRQTFTLTSEGFEVLRDFLGGGGDA